MMEEFNGEGCDSSGYVWYVVSVIYVALYPRPVGYIDAKCLTEC